MFDLINLCVPARPRPSPLVIFLFAPPFDFFSPSRTTGLRSIAGEKKWALSELTILKTNYLTFLFSVFLSSHVLRAWMQTH
jgi:hypothetical protein